MRVHLAVPWTDDKGVEHRADTKVQVTPDVGQQLIKDGFAAAVGIGEGEPDTPPDPETPVAPKPPAPPAHHHQSPSSDGNPKEAGDGRS